MFCSPALYAQVSWNTHPWDPGLSEAPLLLLNAGESPIPPSGNIRVAPDSWVVSKWSLALSLHLSCLPERCSSHIYPGSPIPLLYPLSTACLSPPAILTIFFPCWTQKRDMTPTLFGAGQSMVPKFWNSAEVVIVWNCSSTVNTVDFSPCRPLFPRTACWPDATDK